MIPLAQLAAVVLTILILDRLGRASAAGSEGHKPTHGGSIPPPRPGSPT